MNTPKLYFSILILLTPIFIYAQNTVEVIFLDENKAHFPNAKKVTLTYLHTLEKRVAEWDGDCECYKAEFNAIRLPARFKISATLSRYEVNSGVKSLTDNYRMTIQLLKKLSQNYSPEALREIQRLNSKINALGKRNKEMNQRIDNLIKRRNEDGLKITEYEQKIKEDSVDIAEYERITKDDKSTIKRLLTQINRLREKLEDQKKFYDYKIYELSDVIKSVKEENEKLIEEILVLKGLTNMKIISVECTSFDKMKSISFKFHLNFSTELREKNVSVKIRIREIETRNKNSSYMRNEEDMSVYFNYNRRTLSEEMEFFLQGQFKSKKRYFIDLTLTYEKNNCNFHSIEIVNPGTNTNNKIFIQ